MFSPGLGSDEYHRRFLETVSPTACLWQNGGTPLDTASLLRSFHDKSVTPTKRQSPLPPPIGCERSLSPRLESNGPSISPPSPMSEEEELTSVDFILQRLGCLTILEREARLFIESN